MPSATGDDGVCAAPAACSLCVWLVLLSKESISHRRTCTSWISPCPLCPGIVMLTLCNGLSWLWETTSAELKQKKTTGLTVAPQNRSLPVLFSDRSSYSLVSLCFFCPSNSAWPFLCSTVFQTCSAHAITFLSNTFLLQPISVQSREEP